MVEAVASDPDTWYPILRAPDGTPKVVPERIDRERVREQFEALLSRALARRGGPADVDLELASHSLLVVVEQCGRLVLSDPEGRRRSVVGQTTHKLNGSMVLCIAAPPRRRPGSDRPSQ